MCRLAVEKIVHPCDPFFSLLLLFVGPLQRVRPRNGILCLGLGLVVVLVVLVVVPLRSEFIGEL